MNTDQQELAAYQRAVETAKNDLAHWRRRAEQAEALALTLQTQRDQAEVRVIALMGAITPLLGAWGAEDSYEDEIEALFYTIESLDDMGAELLKELEAARALRAAVQPLGSMARLNEACATYDEVVKARSE